MSNKNKAYTPKEKKSVKTQDIREYMLNLFENHFTVDGSRLLWLHLLSFIILLFLIILFYQKEVIKLYFDRQISETLVYYFLVCLMFLVIKLFTIILVFLLRKYPWLIREYFKKNLVEMFLKHGKKLYKHTITFVIIIVFYIFGLISFYNMNLGMLIHDPRLEIYLSDIISFIIFCVFTFINNLFTTLFQLMVILPKENIIKKDINSINLRIKRLYNIRVILNIIVGLFVLFLAISGYYIIYQ